MEKRQPTAVFFYLPADPCDKENAKFVRLNIRNRQRFNEGHDFTSILEK